MLRRTVGEGEATGRQVLASQTRGKASQWQALAEGDNLGGSAIGAGDKLGEAALRGASA